MVEQVQNQQIKLHYFDTTARGETIRLCLILGGIQFEDIRYNPQLFMEQKNSGFFKFGQLPVLEIDGKQYAQSAALNKWAGRLTGFYPDDDLKALQCDEALQLLDDLFNRLHPVFREQDPSKKQVLAHEYSETTVPQWAGYAEKLLEQNGTGFFSGDSLSLADINWYVFIGMHRVGKFAGVPIDIFTKYTRLNALFEKINNLELVKNWNKAHNQQF